MGSNSNIEVYERVTAGLGDMIMLRPAIIGNMKKKPDARHVLHAWRGVSRIFDDVEGLEVVPVEGSEEERYKKSRELLRDYNSARLYELSASALQYEQATQPNVDKSRQEIFCGVVGVPFDMENYKVRFSDFEKQFAQHFVCGMDKPIGIHVRASQAYRDYKFMKGLVEDFAKRYSGTIVTFDNSYIHRTRKSNIASLTVEDYRLAWAVMSKMRIMVGPDSFGVHAAGSVGVPVYGLFGPTDPRCRLKYRDVAWPGSYWKCGRQYCWYKPCKQWSCLNTRLPGYFWDDMVEKLGAFLSGDGCKPWGRCESVAVVRMRGIGDLLMLLPAIDQQRKNMSMYGKVTVITNSVNVPLVKASGLVDKVISVDYKHSPSGLPPPPDIDYGSYDRVFNLINVYDYAPLSDRTARVSLIGACLGISGDGAKPPELRIPSSWLRKAERLLEDNGIYYSDTFIAFQVDSEGQSRYWPRRRWEKFLELAYKRGYKVVLLSDQWQNSSHPEAVNLTGKTDIETYVGIIALSSVFVGPDSSGVHIAGCLGKKAVGLYGSVDPKLRVAHYPTVKAIVGRARCVPCNDWGKMSCEKWRKPVKCMWSIRAGRVMREVKRVLC